MQHCILRVKLLGIIKYAVYIKTTLLVILVISKFGFKGDTVVLNESLSGYGLPFYFIRICQINWTFS